MKRIYRIFITALFLFCLSATAVFADNLDVWLDKYEKLVQRAEAEAEADSQNYEKITTLTAEREKLFAKKDKIQAKEGNFTIGQGTRYAALNTRWSLAKGSFAVEKGSKKLSDKLNKFFGSASSQGEQSDGDSNYFDDDED